MSKIKCWLFGHKYSMDIKFSNNMQKIKCDRCHKKFGINHDVRTILPWDSELDNMARLVYPEKFTP